MRLSTGCLYRQPAMSQSTDGGGKRVHAEDDGTGAGELAEGLVVEAEEEVLWVHVGADIVRDDVI